jgi:hypothetical protein
MKSIHLSQWCRNYSNLNVDTRVYFDICRVYADGVNILGGSIHTIKKTTEML